MKTTSHKVDVSILDGLSFVQVASATTVDGTQRKTLTAAVGKSQFLVRRWYIAFLAADRKDPETVYEGADLTEAVRLYNGLG